MDGAFFYCSEAVAVANDPDKKNGKNKKRKGYKGNAEQDKNIPWDGIYDAMGMTIRSVQLGIQCN